MTTLVIAERIRYMTITVKIYADGSCKGNPGPGGWGVLIMQGEDVKELYGGMALTTNNQMELQAAISALEHFKSPTTIEMNLDSQYVKNGITQWIKRWKTNGWKTADKKPVKNIELWKKLDAAAEKHQVKWNWVRGHNGNVYNEMADELANKG